jgi:hypothetical protein
MLRAGRDEGGVRRARAEQQVLDEAENVPADGVDVRRVGAALARRN